MTTDAEARSLGRAPEWPGLHDRVEAIGGTLDVASPPDAGTTVAAVVPVDWSQGDVIASMSGQATQIGRLA